MKYTVNMIDEESGKTVSSLFGLEPKRILELLDPFPRPSLWNNLKNDLIVHLKTGLTGEEARQMRDEIARKLEAKRPMVDDEVPF